MRIIKAFRSPKALLRFDHTFWANMITELGRRGRGKQESGAFLLARRDHDARKVVSAVYLDDLDPNCLRGGIHFDGRAYGRLWDICDRERLRVLGDVHTHPSDWVEQSSIDRDNPMVARRDHVALIVPFFGSRSVASRDIGVHQYRGDDGWQTWLRAEAASRLYIGRWA